MAITRRAPRIKGGAGDGIPKARQANPIAKATERPIADFMELGALLLMFVSGLEIDVIHFRQARKRSVLFGLITTGFPLLLGIVVGLIFGYQPTAPQVIASP